jgi:hypothetical protein
MAQPLRPYVDRANYIVHLKVVGIEEPTEVLERDGDSVTYGPEYAVCDVKEIVLGMIATDKWGRVRLSCPSRKNSRHLSTEVRYAVGDEVTIISDAATLDPDQGMIFPGGGHPNRRPRGEPTRQVRELVNARASHAEALRDALDKLLPGSAAAAEKALDEFEQQVINDFTRITPEADLLLDVVAMARYTPDVALLPRPSLDDKTRARLTRIALRALCELSPAGADIAAEVVEGTGNGVYGLLRPAAVEGDSALRKLADRGEFETLAGHLLRHDCERRALTWVCKLAQDSTATAELAQWAVIETVEGGWAETPDADTRLAPERSTSLPYDNAGQRGVANAIDKRANWLACWLVIREGAELAASEKIAGSAQVMGAHAKRIGELYASTEMLQVYGYVLAVRGADDKQVAAARKQMEAKRGKDGVDLADVADIEFELKKLGKLPAALKRVVRQSKWEGR